jgi:cell division protein FtsB
VNSLFNNFLSLLNNLDGTLSRVSIEEQFDTLFVNYEESAIKYKEFFKKDDNKEFLKDSTFSFKFQTQGSPSIYDEKFLETSLYIIDSDIITLTLSVNKIKAFALSTNELLFFDLDSFLSKYRLYNESLQSILKNMDFTKIIHIYLPIKEMSQNQFIKIIPHNELGLHSVVSLEEKHIQEFSNIRENREELTRIEFWFPLPQIFSLRTSEVKLNEVFSQNLFFTSLMHIANKYINDKFVIRGQKNLELSFDKGFAPKNATTLYAIYRFSFGEEQTQDKLEITRNIITIYLHQETIEQLDEQLEKMKQTIERHFSMYVQDKIKKFFDDTKDAIDLAHKYALEARDAADKIATNISTSILALITAVFSGIVIMSRGNFLFLVVALLLHILYFILSYSFNRHFALKKKNDITDIYDLTSKNFTNIAPDEKEEIKEKYILPAINSITTNLRKYLGLTISLIVFMVILIIGSYFAKDLINNTTNQPTQSVTTEQKSNKNIEKIKSKNPNEILKSNEKSSNPTLKSEYPQK